MILKRAVVAELVSMSIKCLSNTQGQGIGHGLGRFLGGLKLLHNYKRESSSKIHGICETSIFGSSKLDVLGRRGHVWGRA